MKPKTKMKKEAVAAEEEEEEVLDDKTLQRKLYPGLSIPNDPSVRVSTPNNSSVRVSTDHELHPGPSISNVMTVLHWRTNRFSGSIVRLYNDSNSERLFIIIMWHVQLLWAKGDPKL